MIADLPQLEALPRQKASDVKNRWRDLVREVHASGSVAITNHSTVEMVLLTAEAYRALAASAAALKEREASTLDRLSAEFQARLAGLQAPTAGAQAAAVFEGQGRIAGPRPKAGPAF